MRISGKATLNILKIVKKELSISLGIAIRRAAKEKRSILYKDVHLRGMHARTDTNARDITACIAYLPPVRLSTVFHEFSTSFPRGNTKKKKKKKKNKIPAHVQHVRRKAKKLSPCVPYILFAFFFFWCRHGKKEANRTGGRYKRSSLTTQRFMRLGRDHKKKKKTTVIFDHVRVGITKFMRGRHFFIRQV
jgi:hypothetical protein